MTGLNLETFLHLLRADLGAWVSLAVVVLILSLMLWTSWGSRRALRKCLVLSLVVHMGLVLYGSALPVFLVSDAPRQETTTAQEGIRQIRVAPVAENGQAADQAGKDGRSRRRTPAWDRPTEALALADPSMRPARPEAAKSIAPERGATDNPPPVADPPTAPEVNPPEPPGPEQRAASVDTEPPQQPRQVAPGDPSEIADAVVAAPEAEPDSAETPLSPADGRLRTARTGPSASERPMTRGAPDPVQLPDAPAIERPATTKAAEARPRPPLDPSTAPLPPVASAEPDSNALPASRNVADVPAQSEGGLAMPDDANLRTRARRPRTVTHPASQPATREIATAAPARPTDSPVPAAPRNPATTTNATAAHEDSADLLLPEAEVRQRSRPNPVRNDRTTASNPPLQRTPGALGPIALNRVSPSGPAALSDARSPIGGRPLSDIPPMYRSRVDPNRSVLAQRAGASAASEQAVERGLDWLARHQDDDGRWNGGSARPPVPGLVEESRDSFLIHCPPNEICQGECSYAEADTALTGLALLAYLGAGYTHTEGKYAATVGRGLRYLLLQQKPDGDLRGPSRAVGLYCHAMATLALSEAYAMSGDDRLRGPVERAVDFLVKAQALDGMSWRYAPRDSVGDTSILGWVVLVLRSARAVGIVVPDHVHKGALTWLQKVEGGRAGGLARYQPFKEVTETMTAEAWVCRQLLGSGSTGAASTEAADFLLAHGPDRGPFNLYYWYYGTLAMYQAGGPAWTHWNEQVRDQLVKRQRSTGHPAGSWDPDEDETYGTRGGRIYSTALATLTLEVYYRYLRFYDQPARAPRLAPAPDHSTDPTLRRARNVPPAGRR